MRINRPHARASRQRVAFREPPSRRLRAVAPLAPRTILRLHFEHDFTQAEIAEHVGLSQMHVARLIRQAIERLQATTPRS